MGVGPEEPVFRPSPAGTTFLIWLIPALVTFSAVPAPASCSGLQGDALQRCLQGEGRETGPPAVTFYDAQGKAVSVDKAVVSRSMMEVCQKVGRDGVFKAYRSDGDRRQARIWKEVECRKGRVEGLWKEYFPSDDTMTVLHYDATGRAVKQSFYYNGRLVRENTLNPK